MVFSREAVRHLVFSCECPRPDSPDDMIVGACARRLGLPVLHSAAFHQAQRRDYAPAYVAKLPAVSFHKLEGLDPYQEYMEHLHERDPTPEHHEL